jgi:hypothetical protein
MTSRNPSKTSNPKYSFTWDTNEPADFQCKLNGRVVDCGSGTSGRYTTPNLPDGRHAFELTAVDNVGNRRRPQVFRWVTGISRIELSFFTDISNLWEEQY